MTTLGLILAAGSIGFTFGLVAMAPLAARHEAEVIQALVEERRRVAACREVLKDTRKDAFQQNSDWAAGVAHGATVGLEMLGEEEKA